MKEIWTWFGVLCFICAAFTATGQEICDNGIDDNGNGLIDLNDSECQCSGILSGNEVQGVIPNPSFENNSCCPSAFGDINCVNDWVAGSNCTTDYLNECNFVLPPAAAMGLVPFPDGSGAIGMYSSPWCNEYISTCLNSSFETGTTYTLTFTISTLPLSGSSLCNNGNPTYGPFNFTLFGSPNCNFLNGAGDGCPVGNAPDWIDLGFVIIPPVVGYGEVEVVFTPTVDIAAIMLGGPCVMPPGYTGNPCQAYFILDNLILQEESVIDDLDIQVLNNPCDPDYTLEAFVNHSGGSWQWYFNGIALSGEVLEQLDFDNIGKQTGTYQAVYSFEGECIVDSILLQFPPIDTGYAEVWFCEGYVAECGGEAFTTEGIFDVLTTNSMGCDTVIQCDIKAYPIAPETHLDMDTCAGTPITVCGLDYTQSGYYEIICTDWRGCDSLIFLELDFIEPFAIVQPPAQLQCVPNASVFLDGLLSLPNPSPQGLTFYSWSGPIGGIEGPFDEPSASAILPGEYCLTLTYEFDGTSCSHTACVMVQSAGAAPLLPMLDGPPGGCQGDSLIYSLQYNGAIPFNEYTWVFPDSLTFVLINDSTVLFIAETPQEILLCGYVENDCGSSDTMCIQFYTISEDTLFISSTTCDSSEAGVNVYDGLSQLGCDSIVVQTLFYQPSHILDIYTGSCDPSLQGVDTLFMTSILGCDSLEITHTSLWISYLENEIEFTCDSNAIGVDTMWLSSINGCDSIIVIQRVFSPHYESVDQVILCGTGNNYTDTLIVNGGNCDSLFISEFIFVSADTTYLNYQTCDPSQTGEVITLLQNTSGCDSLLIATYQLLPSDTTFVNEVTCLKGGEISEILVLTNQDGCDSLVYHSVIYVGIDTQFIQLQTCDSSMVGNQWLVTPGINCDTVVNINVQWAPTIQTTQIISSCAPFGPIADTMVLTTSSGCDSIIIRQFIYSNWQGFPIVTPEMCAGDGNGIISLENITGGMPPFFFQLNSGTWTLESLFSNLSPGIYNVIVRDAEGCTHNFPGIIVEAGLMVNIDIGPDMEVDLGSIIDLNVQSGQILNQWQWNASDPLGCISCPMTQLGPVTSSQTVTLQAWTQDGCSDTDVMQVTIRHIEVDVPSVFIPNSFSPNGDGINDIFSIFGNDQVISIQRLAIYDRWGNALYEQVLLPINDLSVGWDGTFRGKEMDPAVYVYVAEVELSNGQVRIYKGDVTLTK